MANILTVLNETSPVENKTTMYEIALDAFDFEYKFTLLSKLYIDYNEIIEQKECVQSIQEILSEEGLNNSVYKFLDALSIVYAAESHGKAMPKLSNGQYTKQETFMVCEALEWSLQRMLKNADEALSIFIVRIANFIGNGLQTFKRIQIIIPNVATRLKQAGHIRPDAANKAVEIIDPSRFNGIITSAFKGFEQAEQYAVNAAEGRPCNETEEIADLALDRINWKIDVVPDVSGQLLHLLKRAEKAEWTITKLRQALRELQKLTHSKEDDDNAEIIKARIKHISDGIRNSCRNLSLAMRQTFAVAHSFIIAANARVDASQHV
jgi:hypothetical protein